MVCLQSEAYRTPQRCLFWYACFCHLLAIGLVVNVIHTHQAFAEDENETNPSKLATVVVTAQKLPDQHQTGDVDTDETPAFYTRITRDQFEGKIDDLATIIADESGIQVRQSGGVGSFSAVSLRGTSAEHVMVYLDGMLLNDASGGGVNLSNISLADIESIEIYKGVTPINFGNASIGGVVNIKTIQPEKGLKAKAACGYGSFDTRHGSGFVNYKPGKWDLLTVFDHLQSDNDFEILNDNNTPYNSTDDHFEKRCNAQFDQNDWLMRWGYDFNSFSRLDFLNQFFDKNQGLSTYNNTQTDATLGTQRNIATLKLTANDLTALHLNTSSQLNFVWKNETYDDPHGRIGLSSGNQQNQNLEYETIRYGGSTYCEWIGDMQIVGLRLEVNQEIYQQEDLLAAAGEQFPDSRRTSYITGIQDSLYFLEDELIVTPGLRYTFVDDQLKTTKLASERKKQDRQAVNPQIGFKYHPLTELIIKANVGKYVREPSFYELFGDRGFFNGNADLKPERAINIDGGFEIDCLWQRSYISRLSLEAVYFKTLADDLIVKIYDARGVGQSDNIPESRIEGFEFNMNMKCFDYLRISGNATWQDTHNGHNHPSFYGKKLPGIYHTSYLSRLEVLLDPFKLFGEYIHESDMYYTPANHPSRKAKPKNEINVGVSWCCQGWTVSAEIRNLTDRQYEDFHGYPTPGRIYYASLTYSYDDNN